MRVMGLPLTLSFPYLHPFHPTGGFSRLGPDVVQKAPPGDESGEPPLPKDTSCTVVCVNLECICGGVS